MLKQTLNSINSNLRNLIKITEQDIEDIKQANHQALFDRNIIKENLIDEFVKLKAQIDNGLKNRSETGQNLVNVDEQPLLDEFKENIQTFYTIHKKFAKMAFTVTHFYNNLVHKVTDSQPDIGYGMSPNRTNYSNFSLKG
jgi:hypothetical protein